MIKTIFWSTLYVLTFVVGEFLYYGNFKWRPITLFSLIGLVFLIFKLSNKAKKKNNILPPERFLDDDFQTEFHNDFSRVPMGGEDAKVTPVDYTGSVLINPEEQERETLENLGLLKDDDKDPKSNS